MNRLLEFLRNIPPQRLLIIGSSTFFVFLAIVIGSLLLAGPRYSILFGNLSSEDSASIVNALESIGEPYKIGEGNNSVLVPADRIARLRIAMAERGLPNEGSLGGYEIFDKDQGFGTSNFVQEINHLRALEGELAKTISTIDGIKRARVHLVLPKRELFSRDKRSPSASVILSISGSKKIDKSKIRAIRSLVSSAVPDLTDGNISIIDSNGQLLARGVTEDDDSFFLGGATPDEIRSSYEKRLATDLQSLVESVVGYSNARVEVRVEMDFSQTVIQEKIYDPEGQVLESSEEVNETSQRTDNKGGQVTVENNLPGQEDNPSSGQAETVTQSTHNEVRNNYRSSSQDINRVIQPGQIEKISVAVLVDGVYSKNETGDTVYTPREVEELQQIERLVKTAIAYDENVRQDNVEIVNLRFAAEERDAFLADNEILGFQIADVENLVELIVLSIVALVVFLLVLRPLLIRALSNDASTRGNVRVRSDGTVVDSRTGETVGAAPNVLGGMHPGSGGLAGTDMHAGSLLDQLNHSDQLVDLVNVDAQIRQTLSKQLNEVAEKYPSETGSVIKGWLTE